MFFFGGYHFLFPRVISYLLKEFQKSILFFEDATFHFLEINTSSPLPYPQFLPLCSLPCFFYVFVWPLTLEAFLNYQVILGCPLLFMALRSYCRASLVAQWLRICLPMQGMRVQALVWEDPTCHGAAGPVSHNY